MGSDTRRDAAGPAAIPEVANLGIVRPPLVYLTSVVLGLALHVIWPVRFLPVPGGQALGGAVILVALALFVSAVRALRAAGTPVPGNRPTTAIVRAGPYRLSRNPIYLSFSLLQLGIALCVGGAWLVATLAAAVGLMAGVVIPREERYLAARFPSDYPAYRASVRRWL